MLLFSAYSLLTLQFLFFAQSSVLADITGGDGTNCSCGFYDALTKELFTDSIIVYFNESTELPLADFHAESYQNNYEKDWNAVYRQGADPANLQLNASHKSLDLYIKPSTEHHEVVGAAIRTLRQDIQYGSFRSLMRSPPKNSGGSAMSMMLQYNESQVTELSLMSTDKAAEAWVGTFVHDEFTTRNLGVNYSVLTNVSSANRNYTVLANTAANGSLNPWEFTEYRIDWTKDAINFYVGGNCTRTVLRKDDDSIQSVPAPVYFKHWSTGNKYSMEGPPKNRTLASVRWIRMFFNSSLTTENQKTDFVTHCQISDACSMDDITLRGSSPQPEKATLKWKQADPRSARRMPALWISAICIAFSSLLLLHAFIRRAPWKRQAKPSGHGNGIAPTGNAVSEVAASEEASKSCKRASSHYSEHRHSLSLDPGHNHNADDDLAIEAIPPPYSGEATPVNGGHSSRAGSVRWDSRGTTPRGPTPYSSNFNTTVEDVPLTKGPQGQTVEENEKSKKVSEKVVEVQILDGDNKIPLTTVTESEMPAPRMAPRQPRERIDYLAGLVAICSVIVTVMHFGLSYVPAIVIPGAPTHHRSEYWVQQIISPFILNQMWLGVFFTTSTRFLVQKYFKDGNLKHIAQGAVRRTPRLMIPVASVALLEYFLINVGVTHYLEYAPSISWSTWPYVTQFPSVGIFISEVLELIYLIPNAVPQITFNYCTGVLWTIAVQLQGSWLVLLGAVVVYEIKTPWKRMCYYAFCVVNHWYAQSWGCYLWIGVVLTDLDVTYKYRPWLYARPYVYYPLIFTFWLIVATGFAANVLPNWTSYNFATYENNIHPDLITGEPIARTDNAGYPPYFVPRLNGLLFAAGMQCIVELSPAVQWFLSRKPFLLVFPHIFTIYLLHGLIFWSWGSWLLVLLASHGFGYGVNIAIVGVTSYTILFMSLPVVTPVIEALGKDITALVWQSATEVPPPRRPTLFPFPNDMLANREEGAAGGTDSGRTVGNSGTNSVTDSGSNSLYKGLEKNSSTSRFSV
ncbi:glycoside hydrolase family 16 protein [Lepidopterella palustris CBS 459.81]|uniref:Glycoside hydrolase family 16 protein n=1 Tax=Lepidopterella palustris CBS 459.81 TaxID=1314670 RepID=A0A8E2E4M2_9PEZI|nr:glycoside hydrolase family 16 protein [Lepidopterella palustris CBS 459.81]